MNFFTKNLNKNFFFFVVLWEGGGGRGMLEVMGCFGGWGGLE